MQKGIGDKIYYLVIGILVFSILYQSGFLLVNLISTSVEHNRVSAEVSVEGDFSVKEEREDEENNSSFFLYLLKQGIPYSNDSDYNLSEILKQVTDINFNDPKTLIGSQIPIIESYEKDDVIISPEEEKEIYSIATSKPLNDDKVEVHELSGEPLVLIYSTHTTESYSSSSKLKIDYSSYARSLNENHNMIAIGQEIKRVLEEKYNIKVIHDKTVHDYPSYGSSYTNSLNTIKKNLKKYPSIKYVFDIHRDGLAENKKNREKYAAVINEVDTAKIMMVLGLNHENHNTNVDFSNKVYNEMKNSYPSIVLPTIKREKSKYNQFVSDNAVLFEVGSNLSTLEEAKESAKLLGEVLGKVIVSNENN